MAKNDPAAEGAAKAQPSGAPELDSKVLDTKRRKEIEAAFIEARDADVVATLPDDDTAAEDRPVDASDTRGGDDAPADDSKSSADKTPPSGGPSRSPLSRFFAAYGRHKKWTIPLTILLLAVAVMAVPASRYPVLALFMKQDVAIAVTDDGTKKPVSSAIVELDGTKVMTDNEGRATVRARVGERSLKVTKRYYRETVSMVFVGVRKADTPKPVSIQATGRQVPLSVVNRLTGKPVENALVVAAGTEIKTDAEGKAMLVVPADKQTQPVEISGAKFNTLKATLTVSETAMVQNNFQLVPSGKVYFLSKQTGKIDVVKTNLDGSDRKTVVAGTGKEEERNTILLASRDWKYLAFMSKRDAGPAKLYLIDTATDKMSEMDSGDASFVLTGWKEHTFVYRVTRTKLKQYAANRQAVKTFDADKRQLKTLDQTAGDQPLDLGGVKYETIDDALIVGDKLVYLVGTHRYSLGADAEYYNTPDYVNFVRTVGIDSGSKKELKSFSEEYYSKPSLRPYGPQELYIVVHKTDWRDSRQNGYEFFEYENASLNLEDVDQEKFFSTAYPTYLQSPDGKRVFWSEQRDGKIALLVGNQNGENGKTASTVDEGQTYGWYGDEYLLVSKKGSELYILPASGGTPLKISDYHRPSASFPGYGGGYGGL